jgi:hypothetical protein
MDDFQVVLLVWTVVWGPIAFCALFMFCKRTDKFPIKQRWPNMVIFTMSLHLSCMLMLNLVDVVLSEDLPAILDSLCLFSGAVSAAFWS